MRQELEDASLEGIGRRGITRRIRCDGSISCNEGEMKMAVVGMDQIESDRAEGRRRAMLGGEGEAAVTALQVEERVRPGIEIRGAAEAVSGA